MVTKVRKQIYIDPDQDVLLKRLAKETGATEAEIIRQAINSHTRLFRFPKRDLTAWDNERAFIANLIEQDSVAGQRSWGREDLYGR